MNFQDENRVINELLADLAKLIAKRSINQNIRDWVSHGHADGKNVKEIAIEGMGFLNLLKHNSGLDSKNTLKLLDQVKKIVKNQSSLKDEDYLPSTNTFEYEEK